MVTTEEIQAIKERASKATAGPWLLARTYTINGPVDPENMKWRGPDTHYKGKPYRIVRVRENQHYRDKDRDAANAMFIAHARQDVDDLLEYIEYLEGKLDG